MKQNRNALRGGAYSLIVTAVVLAMLIVINILAGALPDNLTKYDISSSKLYSITSNTKAVVNGLDKDVTIYWIVQADKEDPVIENLLNKYDSLSDHIQVVKKNPDVYPTFAKNYTDETVANNSLVVESGERSRFISYDDIYVKEADVYSYSYNTSFDGEGAITSAIDYVVNEEQPKMYLLEGHGEKELPASFKEQIEKENIQLDQLSLLNVDSVPEDADGIMIYGPSSDISEAEKEILSSYTKNGGKLFVAAGPVKEGSLVNLHGLIEEYGVTAEEGVVVEGDREHYALQTPYALLNVDSVPEDADGIMIYGPSSDISEAEKEILSSYTKNGGKLFVAAGPVKEGSLVNLHGLIEEYGVTAEEGVVVEGDREHYALQTPYALLPEMESSSITDPLIEEHYYPILPLVEGLKVDETEAAGRVTTLLSTTAEAFSKTAGYNLSTYEKEEGDIDGPFAAAVSIACENDGQILWFGSSDFLEDMYNALSSGANNNLGMNAISSMIGQSEAMAIRSKSLNYNYLTISDSTSAMLQAMMIGIFPLIYLGIGICVVMRRRRMQNEAG